MFEQLLLFPSYNSYERDIARDFYDPVLKKAVAFDRVTAYFDAKALSHYAKGLEHFARHGCKYRLIVSTQLSEADFESIKQGYELRNEVTQELRSQLARSIELSADEHLALSNLAHLITLGVVDIKMAFTPKGIMHAKFGLLYDESGNVIDFQGSNNDTAAAITANYESFQITCSWLSSPFDRQKIQIDADIFERLWSDNDKKIVVKSIPDVVLHDIVKYDKGAIVVADVPTRKECVILDIADGRLVSYTRVDPVLYRIRTFHKLKLNYFIDHTEGETTYFKDWLTYIDYKKVIDYFRTHSTDKGYSLYISDALSSYIDQQELNIDKRARLGLDIKRHNDEMKPAFEEFKRVVDGETARQLRDRQMWDAFFLYTMRKAANFSVPGAGKTATVLGVYAYLHKRAGIKRIMMVGPLNSFGSWENEFIATFGGKQVLHSFNLRELSTKEAKSSAIKLETGSCNLLLFNYESLPNYVDDLLSILDEHTMLVMDEIHRIKAVDGYYASAALKLSSQAKYTIALTGTPIPNSYVDLYNLLNILFPNEYRAFFGYDVQTLAHPSPAQIAEINESIQPFYCRTTKDQLNVPRANEDDIIKLSVTPDEDELFHILAARYRENPLALILRTLQLESDPRQLMDRLDLDEYSDIMDGYGSESGDIDFFDYSDDIRELVDRIDVSTKRKKAIELIESIVNDGHPVIVWCIFTDSMNGIAQMLIDRGISCRIISGSVSSSDREPILNAFKRREFDVLITNPHTLGESVSLHGVCHDAIYYEYSYNLVHLLQSKDRIHRLGLPDDQYTQYYYLQDHMTKADGSPFSLDEKIYTRLKEKETTMLEAIERQVLEGVSSTAEDLDAILGDLFN